MSANSGQSTLGRRDLLESALLEVSSMLTIFAW